MSRIDKRLKVESQNSFFITLSSGKKFSLDTERIRSYAGKQDLIETNPEKVVCIIAQRNLEFVVGLLHSLFKYSNTLIIDPRQGKARMEQCLSGLRKYDLMIDNVCMKKMGIPNSLPPPQKVINLTEFCADLENTSILNKLKKTILTRDKDLGDATIFTSGSTGEPKGVVISGEDLIDRIEMEIEWFKLTSKDNILGVLPFSFDVGLLQLLGTIFAGGNFCILDSWFPKDIIACIKENKINGMAASPIIWKTLLKYKDQQALWDVLNSLRYITLSGGGLPEQTLQQIVSLMKGPKLIKTYGQSEFFRISSFCVQSSPDKLASVGKAYGGVKIEIRGEDGQLRGSDVAGEIFASGLGRMNGYLGEPPTTTKQLNSFHATGDIGSLDENGYLTVRGRIDEMVKILDQRVYPEEVARMIDKTLEVSGTEVVTLEHNSSIKLIAFQQSSFFNQVPPDKILLKLRKAMPSHMIPAHFELLTEWPSTESGKIDKMVLKSLAKKLFS